jgi:tRNA dimethylallyltransferase
MIERGWISEVANLLSAGYSGNEAAFQSLGYPEIISVVRAGADLSEAISKVEIKTRQYAKRQRTWFRHLANVKWLSPA